LILDALDPLSLDPTRLQQHESRLIAAGDLQDAQFDQRFQHESALREARMRQHQLVGSKPEFAVQQQIDVQRARLQVRARRATGVPFELLPEGQELLGRHGLPGPT
jgi:hypothetical protein